MENDLRYDRRFRCVKGIISLHCDPRLVVDERARF